VCVLSLSSHRPLCTVHIYIYISLLMSTVIDATTPSQIYRLYGLPACRLLLLLLFSFFYYFFISFLVLLCVIFFNYSSGKLCNDDAEICERERAVPTSQAHPSLPIVYTVCMLHILYDDTCYCCCCCCCCCCCLRF
jgi:hypothetical protein